MVRSPLPGVDEDGREMVGFELASRSAGHDCANNATVSELKGGDP